MNAKLQFPRSASLASSRRLLALPGVSGLSLRERALAAGEAERERTRHEERVLRLTELEHARSELVRLMQSVLGEQVDPQAIALPADPMQRPYLVLTVEADGLSFSASDYPTVDAVAGEHRLKVSLTCPKCGDTDWHAVPSLSALGTLLGRVEDGTINQSCSTCLMCQQWEDDPFCDE